MASRSNLVNLDAMIKRADFAAQESESASFENVSTISLRDFTKEALIGPMLRKPDFQRETNHWTPTQVGSLLECFINGDLIPSVILWHSHQHLFVVDGGHRLSALKAWIEDDYGDGPISQTYFSYTISAEQKRNAEKTRTLVNTRIGSWQHYYKKLSDDNIDKEEKRKLVTATSRGIPIQWVKGNADKAESSFFKINKEGTPLDSIEELLLKNRLKPIPIAARAVIRAGMGHKYWSAFPSTATEKIEKVAKELHATLFEPELKSPIKTLDLPLGGSKGVRNALQVLIDYMLYSARDQAGDPKNIHTMNDDFDGSETVNVLHKALQLTKRITGNDSGSLGLHPAVYFYGPTGRHSGPMFMGTIAMIAKQLSNNNKNFFKLFTQSRAGLEEVLINNKDLIATILQKHISSRRVAKYATILEEIMKLLNNGEKVGEDELVKISGLEGKIVTGVAKSVDAAFTDDVKSEGFINIALQSAVKCSICKGYLDVTKSISYDHVERKRDGGKGDVKTCSYLIHIAISR